MKQPNSLHCFVCGVENPSGLHLTFYDTAAGEVTAEYTVPEQFQGFPGVVHGGIVAAMLDETMGRVFLGSVDQPRFMFTARLEVRYRKNVPIGIPLRIVGRLTRSKSHSATAVGAIYHPDGSVLAEAECLLMNVPAHLIENKDTSQLGWQVYPD